MAKAFDGGGDERVLVDDEAELAKEVGPAEGPKTKEGVLMAKEEYFTHGGKGGIAKSAMAAPFFLVAKSGSFGHVASASSVCQQSLK